MMAWPPSGAAVWPAWPGPGPGWWPGRRARRVWSPPLRRRAGSQRPVAPEARARSALAVIRSRMVFLMCIYTQLSQFSTRPQVLLEENNSVKWCIGIRACQHVCRTGRMPVPLRTLSSGSQVGLGNPIATQAELGAFPMPSTAWQAMTRSQAQLGNEENNP